MTSEKVHFTKEKATLLATLYGRAQDSMSDDPVLGDKTAKDVIDRIDYDFQKFRMRRGDLTSVAIRAKQLDLWAAEFLAAHPDATVLDLGCGLDSRVVRLDPPSSVHWYDLDYPDVIEIRRRLYPARDGYGMIGSSVTDLDWLDGVPSDRPALVIAEGLLIYLSEEDIRRLLSRIVDRFPGGQLLFDAISRLGVRLQRLNRAVQSAGATITWGLDDPRQLERWDPRIRLLTELSALDLPGGDKLPRSYRMIQGAMKLVPPLRRAGMLLRYEFSQRPNAAAQR